MKTIFYSFGLLLPISAAALLRRVAVEYETLDRLSDWTVTQVWMFYVAHAALTGWSAWVRLWPMGIPYWLALPSGLVLLIAGAVICTAGVTKFGLLRRMSGLATNHLITGGIYRWSRNPQNVGLGLALVGLAFAGRSAFALLLTVLFWTVLRIYLPMEEKYLHRIFGEEYQAYCARTGRYISLPKRPIISTK